MPKVSVITGYYRRGELLEPTIRSILDQSFGDLELLVFDDASPDGTGEQLKALASQIADSRLKPIFHSENKGFTRGMIDTISMATGDYIAVQGSGDLSLPYRIERQASFLDAHPDVGAVGCWYTNIVANSGARRLRTPDAGRMTFDQLKRGNIFSHGEVMIRRSAYEAAGGYRAAFRFCQDYDLWLRIIKRWKLDTVPEPLYDRYVRYDGVSYDPDKFPIQARYSLLARRIATANSAVADTLLKKLEAEGPLSLIPKGDSDLQDKILSACFRSIIWGGCDEAEALAEKNIVNPIKRASVKLVARLFSRPFMALPLQGVRRIFKVT